MFLSTCVCSAGMLDVFAPDLKQGIFLDSNSLITNADDSSSAIDE